MNAEAFKALRTIRRCIDRGRYRLTRHFTRRMDERGMVWPDVLALLNRPMEVRSGGLDDADRPKWILSGRTVEGLPIAMACVLDEDDRGRLTVLIMIYWQGK